MKPRFDVNDDCDFIQVLVLLYLHDHPDFAEDMKVWELQTFSRVKAVTAAEKWEETEEALRIFEHDIFLRALLGQQFSSIEKIDEIFHKLILQSQADERAEAKRRQARAYYALTHYDALPLEGPKLDHICR